MVFLFVCERTIDMLNLPKEFTTKYYKLLGTKAEALFSAMNNEAQKKAFRVNTLKKNQNVAYKLTETVPGIPNAYYGQVNSQDPEWVSGTVYSQDPAAMFPAVITGVHPGEKVLDLCAAPGGKSTALAEQLEGDGLLVANDISTTRAKVLRENIERWGITNAIVTNESPQKLAKQFAHFFDKIVVDAPCSGEGMFRKNPAAVTYWSPEYVLFCQERQKEILTAAVQMLRPGGILTYSTCTFAPEEDEQIVSWLVKKFDLAILPISLPKTPCTSGQPTWADQNPALKKTVRFWPNDELGEGQFVAKLQMPTTSAFKKQKSKQIKEKPNRLTKEELELVAKVLTPFNLPRALTDWSNACRVSHNHVYLPVLSANATHLKILNNGLELGMLKKKRFEPSQQLAMVLGQVEQSYVLELNKNDFLSYLHGETLRGRNENLSGFVLISYRQFIFSFGKVTKDGLLKNFYPKGLRIF